MEQSSLSRDTRCGVTGGEFSSDLARDVASPASRACRRHDLRSVMWRSLARGRPRLFDLQCHAESREESGRALAEPPIWTAKTAWILIGSGAPIRLLCAPRATGLADKRASVHDAGVVNGCRRPTWLVQLSCWK